MNLHGKSPRFSHQLVVFISLYLLSIIAVTSVYAAPPVKVPICHVNKFNESKIVMVNEKGFIRHSEHNDVEPTTYYLDADADGYRCDERIVGGGCEEDVGPRSATFIGCEAPDMTGDYSNIVVVDELDCNDGNPAINPDAIEVPGNLIDEDCDGFIDPSLPICMDGALDEAQFSYSPLQNLGLRRTVGGETEEDRLVVSQGSDVQMILDPNNLRISDFFPAGSTVNELSPVIRVNDLDDAVFAVTTNGVVERWDPEGTLGVTSTPVWARNIRRSGCSADTIAAAPLIQLRRLSSAAFEATYATDLVYVGTRYSSLCTGNEERDNKIYALNATTGAIVWSFNSGESLGVDTFMGLAQEEGSDILFATTDRNNSTQDSLWAIDTLTGALLWSVNADSVWSTPLLLDGRVYVATTGGRIRAFDQATGTSLWSILNSVGGIPIIADPRIIKTAAGEVFIVSVDIDGKVWLVREDVFGFTMWSTNLPGTTVAGPLIVGLDGEDLFFGGADGRIYQLDRTTGTVEASRLVAADEVITDLAIQDKHSSGRVPSLFATTDGGRLMRFCQPF